MKLFKITAELRLSVVIHELHCEGEIDECSYCDSNTITINGNHFHITTITAPDVRDLTLLLPYEYDFRDVDGYTQYEILKQHHNDTKFETARESITILDDYEFVDFTVSYDCGFIQFEDLLDINDIHDVNICDVSPGPEYKERPRITFIIADV